MCRPHFHALYAEFEVEIDIRTLEVIKGRLPAAGVGLSLVAQRGRSDWLHGQRNEYLA
jgi:hypothetical protein